MRIFLGPVVESKNLDKWPVLNKSTPNFKLGILNSCFWRPGVPQETLLERPTSVAWLLLSFWNTHTHAHVITHSGSSHLTFRLGLKSKELSLVETNEENNGSLPDACSLSSLLDISCDSHRLGLFSWDPLLYSDLVSAPLVSMIVPLVPHWCRLVSDYCKLVPVSAG